MQTLTPAECLAFLRQPVRTAKLATVRAGGRPHIAPVWFALDGEQILFTTWHASVKAHNLRRDLRLSLCVDDEMPPFAYVIAEGIATLSEDPEALRTWATHIAGRYLGADQAEAYGRRNSVPGEWLVRVTVTKWIGQTDIAGW